MSSEGSWPRAETEIGASRRLFLYSLFLTAAALSAPWLAGLPWRVALSVDLAALPFAAALFRWARGELRRLVWFSDGRWLLVDDRGETHADARLCPGIRLGVRAFMLAWHCGCCGRRFRATLLPDNCDADALRHLAVRLRATPDAELFRSVGGGPMDR